MRIQSADSDYPEVNEDPRSTINAPPWYIALVYPDDALEIRTFVQDNGDIISIFSDPGDQIEAVWSENPCTHYCDILFSGSSSGCFGFSHHTLDESCGSHQ